MLIDANDKGSNITSFVCFRFRAILGEMLAVEVTKQEATWLD